MVTISYLAVFCVWRTLCDEFWPPVIKIPEIDAEVSSDLTLRFSFHVFTLGIFFSKKSVSNKLEIL